MMNLRTVLVLFSRVSTNGSSGFLSVRYGAGVSPVLEAARIPSEEGTTV